MNRFFALIVGVATVAGTFPAAAAAQQPGPARAYRIIVNSENPVGLLTASEISRLFLRKTAAWQHNGQAVQPVELSESSPVRDAFVREIHKKDGAALKSYWQQMVFSGKAVPPPAQDSDAGVMDYVRGHPNAIGYVSASAQLLPDLKPITITR